MKEYALALEWAEASLHLESDATRLDAAAGKITTPLFFICSFHISYSENSKFKIIRFSCLTNFQIWGQPTLLD